MVGITFTEKEIRDLYHALDLSGKLESGQAILESRYIQRDFHTGIYGDEVKTEMLNIRLASNGFKICVAHRTLKKDGSPATEPDPKYIRIDELELRKKI